MRKPFRITIACVFILVLAYGISYSVCVRPSLNTMLGSGYDSFEYPKIPEYGTPVSVRDFGYRKFGFDPEELISVVFRPAFEIDRRFVRERFWGGFDFRDVAPKTRTEQAEDPKPNNAPS